MYFEPGGKYWWNFFFPPIVANPSRTNNLLFRNVYHKTRYFTSVLQGCLLTKKRYILGDFDMAPLSVLQDRCLPWVILLKSGRKELETMDRWSLPRAQIILSSRQFPEQCLRYFHLRCPNITSANLNCLCQRRLEFLQWFSPVVCKLDAFLIYIWKVASWSCCLLVHVFYPWFGSIILIDIPRIMMSLTMSPKWGCGHYLK